MSVEARETVRGKAASGPPRIHLDNAGAALPAKAVRRVLSQHLAVEEAVGGYEAARLAEPGLTNTYRGLAALLGGRPDEIAMTESGTKGWSAAFMAMELGPGDRILTSRLEYVSNYLTMSRRAKACGARVEFIPQDSQGDLDLHALGEMIDARTRLISVAHCAAHNGQLTPVAEIGRMARAAKVPYLLDACQTVGLLPLAVETIGCDILVGTGRKYLRGPRGCGFLYVASSISDKLKPATFDLASAVWTGPESYRFAPGARRFESFEGSIAARVGLGVAVAEATALGVDRVAGRVLPLADRLRSGLQSLRTVCVHDTGLKRGAIVTFTVRGEAPRDTQMRLRGSGVAVAALPVGMALLDLAPRGLAGVVRASPHIYNTEAEIDRLIELLA